MAEDYGAPVGGGGGRSSAAKNPRGMKFEYLFHIIGQRGRRVWSISILLFWPGRTNVWRLESEGVDAGGGIYDPKALVVISGDYNRLHFGLIDKRERDLWEETFLEKRRRRTSRAF